MRDHPGRLKESTFWIIGRLLTNSMAVDRMIAILHHDHGLFSLDAMDYPNVLMPANFGRIEVVPAAVVSSRRPKSNGSAPGEAIEVGIERHAGKTIAVDLMDAIGDDLCLRPSYTRI